MCVLVYWHEKACVSLYVCVLEHNMPMKDYFVTLYVEQKLDTSACLTSAKVDTVSHHTATSEFMGKTFQAAQLTHERFLTIDHSCKIFFWYLPNWTSTNLRCVVLYQRCR